MTLPGRPLPIGVGGRAYSHLKQTSLFICGSYRRACVWSSDLTLWVADPLAIFTQPVISKPSSILLACRPSMKQMFKHPTNPRTFPSWNQSFIWSLRFPILKICLFLVAETSPGQSREVQRLFQEGRSFALFIQIIAYLFWRLISFCLKPFHIKEKVAYLGMQKVCTV